MTLSLRLMALHIGTALSLGLSGQPALSAKLVQEHAAPRAQAGVPGPAATGHMPDTVELAALYYYAQQGDHDRVDREMRRLSLKYADFTAPDDLFKPVDQSTVDETPLWRLYEQDDYDGIDREVSRLAEGNPGWEPSEDFRQKLIRRKLRVAMVKASEAHDWAGVIAAGKDIDPRTEPDADLLWRMIDAYHESGAQEPAAPFYQGLLFREGDNRFDDNVIISTLQKAARDFPASELREAMHVLSASPSLASRMQEVTLDLMRRDVADYAAGLAGAAEPAPATLLAVRRLAEQTAASKDQLLLGWYYLKAKQTQEAETWFRRALAGAPSVEALKGLVLVLGSSGRDEEAFRLTASHLDLAGQDWESFLQSLSSGFRTGASAPVEASVVKAYSDAIQSSQSADHAELLGWYAYNSRQFDAADAWFGKAFDWKPTAASLKGQILTALQRKDKKRVEALQLQFSATYPQVFADIKTAAAPLGTKGETVSSPPAEGSPRYLQSFKAKRYGDCLADLDRQDARRALSPGDQLIRGWCSLGLNRLAEARDAFERALGAGGGKTEDAAYGLGLTLLRSKLVTDAEETLARYPVSPARDKELRSEILWQKARSAFDGKRYDEVLTALNARLQISPETVGMSQMRAWAHYHLGNLGQSRAIFTALNAVVQDPANRRGLATINERMGIMQ